MVKNIVAALLLALATGAHAEDAVVTLSEADFEHTTQAATGQTTGKWFVKMCA
jgi:hypothetical protein